MEPSRNKLIEPLKTLLSHEPDGDILDYILKIETKGELEDFIQNIVDNDVPAHIEAYESIQKILFSEEENSKNNVGNDKYEGKTNKNNEEKSKPTSSKNRYSSKGKKKFQNMNSFQQKEKIKGGRIECNCQGQNHDFMNNCLNCGRIHCEEEGPGPCLYCGTYLEATGRNEITPNFQPQENKIFDDDSDYFKVREDENSKNKKSMVIALDLATRTIIESTEEDEKLRKKILEDCKKHLKNVEQLYRGLQSSSEVKPSVNIYDEMVNILLNMRHIKPSGEEPDLKNEDSKMPDTSFKSKGLIEDLDQGLCLSMHQPYASLLIAGVKKHEGRNWPTNHRGILWIAAAAHKPDPEEVSAVEEFYQDYYNEPNLKFPTNYPTSCLLGCVEVEECLNQENYRKQYPNGESNSPYVLICSNPIILPIFYPIVGQHKIYAMDKHLHKCARLCMRYASLMV